MEKGELLFISECLGTHTRFLVDYSLIGANHQIPGVPLQQRSKEQAKRARTQRKRIRRMLEEEGSWFFNLNEGGDRSSSRLL